MKVVLTAVISLVFYQAAGQAAVGPGMGGTLANIKYIRSDGTRDASMKGSPGFFGAIAFHRRFDEPKSPVHSVVALDLGYKTIGFRDDDSHLLTTWSLRYVSGELSYRIGRKVNPKVSPFLGLAAVSDLLVGGTQQRGFEQYSVSDELRRTNLCIGGEIGLFYTISADAYCMFNLGYLKGLSNIERDPDQTAIISAARISMSVFFELSKK